MAVPAIRTASGAVCQDRAAFLETMGAHFATAERATTVPFGSMQNLEAQPSAGTVRVDNLPTLEGLAQGFAT